MKMDAHRLQETFKSVHVKCFCQLYSMSLLHCDVINTRVNFYIFLIHFDIKFLVLNSKGFQCHLIHSLKTQHFDSPTHIKNRSLTHGNYDDDDNDYQTRIHPNSALCMQLIEKFVVLPCEIAISVTGY